MTATSFNPALHPRDRTRGTATAGQFVTAARAESGVELAGPRRDDPFSDECDLAPGPLLEAVYGAARDLMDSHGLHDWKLGFTDHRGRTLGSTTHASRTISLSAAHMVVIPAAERRDTVLHEIAHALLPPGENHGWRWQAKAREVGASPERHGDVGEELNAIAKVIGTCPMGHVSRRDRKPSRTMACGKEGHPAGQSPYERIITWERNAGDGELNAAVKAAVSKRPARQPVDAAAVPPVGTQVRLNVPQHQYNGATGVVDSKGRTKAIVRLDETGLRVRVPFSMLERA